MNAKISDPFHDDDDPFVAQLNTPNALGLTPLRQASFGDDAEFVGALLRSGADPNLADAQGMCPLQHARVGDVAKTLIAWGANPEVRDDQGRTPLHSAAFDSIRGKPYEQFANRGLTHALIASGANVNALDPNGRTPLHLTRDPTTAGMLVRAGADIGIQDMQGLRPTDGALRDKASAIEAERDKLDADKIGHAGSGSTRSRRLLTRRPIPSSHDLPVRSATADFQLTCQPLSIASGYRPAP